MTDETAKEPPPYDFSTDPDGLTREDFTDLDPLLDVILAVVPGEGEEESSIGLTLLVKGTVVAGKAVSFAVWGKLWASEITRGHEMFGAAMQRSVDSWVKERADFRARREAEDRPVPNPMYICLKDAQIVGSGHRYHAGLMRIKRDQIDAWSLGEPAT